MTSGRGVVEYDLRAAFLEIATGRMPAFKGRVVDLRILEAAVMGGVVTDLFALTDRFDVGHLCDGRRREVLADRLEQRAAELGTDRVVELEHALLPVVASMSARGVRVDRESWEMLCITREAELRAAELAVVRELGVRSDRNERAVLAALRQKGIDADSLGKVSLAPWRGERAVEAILSVNRHAAFLGDIAPKVRDSLRRSRDGRIRAAIDPLGTVTGRFTLTNPNLLGLEKRADVRRCVVPADGHVLISTDVRTAELRVLAALCQEDVIIDAVRAGVDLHRLTGGRLLQLPTNEVSKEERNVGKVVNFTIVFGGGVDAIVEGCAVARLPVSSSEATALYDSFCAAYPRVAGYLNTDGKDLSVARSVLGRMRTFSKPETPAWLNAPVQMSAADAVKFALLAVADQIAPLGAHLLLCVHDELLVESPKETAVEVAEIVRRCVIEQFEATIGGGVPFEVDQYLGPTWAAEDETWSRTQSTTA